MPRWEPPTEQIIQPLKPKRWPFVVLLLAVLGVAIAGLWMIRRRAQAAYRAEALPIATDVRSELSTAADSLQVVVTWQISALSGGGRVDSIRVEVGLGDGRKSQTQVSPSDQRTDTLRLPSPAEGESAAGYSCVATVQAARLSRETCTPWQYVRPTAELPKAATPPASDSSKPAPTPRRKATAGASASVERIVIQPDGQQVDPDIGGKCSAWQRLHPD